MLSKKKVDKKVSFVHCSSVPRCRRRLSVYEDDDAPRRNQNKTEFEILFCLAHIISSLLTVSFRSWYSQDLSLAPPTHLHIHTHTKYHASFSNLKKKYQWNLTRKFKSQHKLSPLSVTISSNNTHTHTLSQTSRFCSW